MIKTGMKNFWKNFLYVFVAMGILYLFLLIVLFSFGGRFISATGTMLGDVVDLANEAIDKTVVDAEDFINFAVTQVEFEKGPFEALKKIFDSDWLEKTVSGFLEMEGANFQEFSDKFQNILDNYLEALKRAFALAVTTLCVGLYLANLATGFLVRRKTAKRNLKQKIFHWVLEPLFSVGYTALMLFLTTIVRGFVLLVFIGSFLIYQTLSLTLVWLIHRDKNVPARDVVNFKNVCTSVLSAILILLIDIAICIVLFFINVIMAILVAVPLLMYTMKIISNNNASYVVSLTEKAAAERAKDDRDAAEQQEEQPAESPKEESKQKA